MSEHIVVKPLEWGGVVPIAESIVGTYSIGRIGGEWKVSLALSAHLPFREIDSGEAPDFETALVEAKEAAQIDFDARILSAIAAPPNESGGETTSIIRRLANSLAIFTKHYETWMDRWGDDDRSSTYSIHTFGELRQARKLIEEADALGAPPAEGRGEACPRTGLRHYYWPQGNCQYCGEMAPPLSTANAEIERLREALKRMENCFEQLAATRTIEVYSAMISSGQGPALLDLDNARRNARDVLRQGEKK